MLRCCAGHTSSVFCRVRAHTNACEQLLAYRCVVLATMPTEDYQTADGEAVYPPLLRLVETTAARKARAGVSSSEEMLNSFFGTLAEW